MRKIVLLLVAFCALFASCDKYQKQPVSYSVTNDALATGFYDVYIPDTGTYTMSALVKFLNGYPEDSVQLILTGLPAGIKVAPDTVSAVPTYSADFVFKTKNMAHGVYPVTLIANTPTQIESRIYNINLIVVPSDAASIFWGNLTDSNACTGRTYKVTAIGTQSNTKGVLTINNFAGFGPDVNINVYLNQQTNTLTLPLQVYGNGSTISGSGTYTESKMIINYTAYSTPTNTSETCTGVFTK